ncbi:MAG: hypothetical protein JSR56_01370 [Proteobacteria bacterium]|nr:hypothetical protein [Pseudomonadota bacterium]
MQLLRLVLGVVLVGGALAESLAAPPPVLSSVPTGAKQTEIRAPATPLRLLPSASVYRKVGDLAVTDDYRADTSAATAAYAFYWDVGKIAGAHGARWQIAAQPFPAFVGGAAADLEPSGLLAQGDGSGTAGMFTGNLKSLLAGRNPDSVYVRVLPLVGNGANVLAGRPSNVIRVYVAGTPPTQDLHLPSTAAKPKPNLYTIKLVEFTPPDFADPNRWGCVVVTGHKPGPPAGSFGSLQTRFPVGAQICPKAYRGEGRHIDSVGDFITWAADGITSAFDWVAGAYNGLKAAVVNTILDVTHACDLIGVAGAGAGSACRTIANAAADAGMLALGVPPSLPNFNQLVDQGIDGAVQFAADAVASQTGIPCTAGCQDLLRKGLVAAGDTLKSTAFSPGCVGDAEAHAHGSEKLCLPDGVITKPAPHSIDIPPMARVEIVRLRHLADAGTGACHVSGKIEFTNQFPGGTVYGPTPAITKDVPTQQVRGELYAQPRAKLPTMGFGQKLVLPLMFGQEIKHEFPWTHQLWSRSQIPSEDAQHPRGPDWFQLYSNAMARISVSSDCSDAKESVLFQRMPSLLDD